MQGNKNLMAAREGVMFSSVYGEDLHKLYPVVELGMSDSGCVDNVLEFLVVAGGRSLPEVGGRHFSLHLLNCLMMFIINQSKLSDVKNGAFMTTDLATIILTRQSITDLSTLI